MPSGRSPGRNRVFLSALAWFGTRAVMVRTPSLTKLARGRPRNGRIADGVTLIGHLGIPSEADGLLGKPLADFALKVVGVLGRERRGVEIMLAGRRDELIAHKRGLPLRIRELDRVDTEEGAGDPISWTSSKRWIRCPVPARRRILDLEDLDEGHDISRDSGVGSERKVVVGSDS